MTRALAIAMLLFAAAPASAGWRHRTHWVRITTSEFVLNSPPVHWSRADIAEYQARVAAVRAKRGIWP